MNTIMSRMIKQKILKLPMREYSEPDIVYPIETLEEIPKTALLKKKYSKNKTKFTSILSI